MLIKRTTDAWDKFYIYRIGNQNLNGGSDYVFKSSRKMGEMALLMDVKGPENILQLENAYFDAMHTRVYGFKTFTMWLIHPAMKQILRLSSMELCSENYLDISLFLRLFNEIWQRFLTDQDTNSTPDILSAMKVELTTKQYTRYMVKTLSGTE